MLTNYLGIQKNFVSFSILIIFILHPGTVQISCCLLAEDNDKHSITFLSVLPPVTPLKV